MPDDADDDRAWSWLVWVQYSDRSGPPEFIVCTTDEKLARQVAGWIQMAGPGKELHVTRVETL
jgi:hypothetical protein